VAKDAYGEDQADLMPMGRVHSILGAGIVPADKNETPKNRTALRKDQLEIREGKNEQKEKVKRVGQKVKRPQECGSTTPSSDRSGPGEIAAMPVTRL